MLQREKQQGNIDRVFANANIKHFIVHKQWVATRLSVFGLMLSPLVESRVLGVSLQRALLDDEAHLLEEGGGGGGRLALQQDVDRLGHGLAQLTGLARGAQRAALGVLAVGQTV